MQGQLPIQSTVYVPWYMPQYMHFCPHIPKPVLESGETLEREARYKLLQLRYPRGLAPGDIVTTLGTS